MDDNNPNWATQHPPPSYAPVPWLHRAHSRNPTSSVSGPQPAYRLEGSIWVEANPPLQASLAPMPHFDSVGPSLAPNQVAHGSRLALDSDNFDPLVQSGAVSAQQAYDEQQFHQYAYPSSVQHVPLHRDRDSPSPKRRRISHPSQGDAVYELPEQHPQSAASIWDGVGSPVDPAAGTYYSTAPLPGPAPATGTAARRSTDDLQQSRLALSTVWAPSVPVWDTTWQLGSVNGGGAPSVGSEAAPSASSFEASPMTGDIRGDQPDRPQLAVSAYQDDTARRPSDGKSASQSDAPQKAARQRVPRNDPADAGLADKSCKQCRIRKVRCSRAWPICARCTTKKLPCHYGNLVPIDLVKTMQPEARVAELEARIKSLEVELALSATTASSPSHFSCRDHSPVWSSPADLPSQIFHAMTSALGATLNQERLKAHTEAVLRDVHLRARNLSGYAGPSTELGPDGATDTPTFEAQLARTAFEDSRLADAELSALPPLERVQHAAWPRLVAWSLLDACWATCSSVTPVFRPYHDAEDKSRLYVKIEQLSPPERCVVLAMCALGVRSTMDVDTLGMAGLDTPRPASRSALSENSDEDDTDETDSQPPQRSLAVQRELIARALRTLMMGLYDGLEVGHGEGDEDALKATLIVGAIMMWNELLPRRSRSLVRVALGQYHDLFDATAALPAPAASAARKHLLSMYALPLLHQDSTSAAYLRTAPLITEADLKTYFAPFAIPTFTCDGLFDGRNAKEWNLREEMLPWLDVDQLGGNTHEQHVMASTVLYRWLAACLRWCAEMSCPRALAAPLSTHTLETLFSLLEQIHSAIQALQYHYLHKPAPVHPTCVGPGGDLCEHLHLRWCTRLDRETDDCVWLAFATAGERLLREERGLDVEVDGDADVDRVDVGWLQECEGRVRQGLKRAAFYFNCFTLSPDPHQSHHLALELELIPSWTFLVAQRFTPPGSRTAPGPGKKADELTETELDWIERGLEIASLYHPVAERRLVELRAHREGERGRVAKLVDAGVTPAFPSASKRVSTCTTSLRISQRDGESNSQTVPQQLDFQQALREALAQTVPGWA